MRRAGRSVGIASAISRQELQDQYRQIGSDLAAKELAELNGQLEVFKTNLEEFARKHRKDIRRDPTFRMHFQKMCSNIGVDPLASNKGFWAELLGVGDFYYELGIQIIEVCMATRERNGGLCEISEVKRRVERMRGVKTVNGSKDTGITEDDIIRSIKTLKPLGNGFEILQIGSKKMVRSIPKEFDMDQTSVLGHAQCTGFVTSPQLQKDFGWTATRSDHVLDELLAGGMCWIDLQDSTPSYWIPSYFQTEEEA